MAQATIQLDEITTAFNGFISRLHSEHPYPISLHPRSEELEDRAAHIDNVCGAFVTYVRACIANTKYLANVGAEEQIDRFEDAAADLVGKIKQAAYRLEAA